MGERTINWLIYTCLIGLIHVISRLFIWSVSKSGIDALAISDLVAFGLVLHASNIHEINKSPSKDRRWGAVHNGFSVVFLVFYSLILMASISNIDELDYNLLTKSTMILCLVSFLLSFSIFFERNAESNTSVGKEAGVA